jgi:hypothetical protein
MLGDLLDGLNEQDKCSRGREERRKRVEREGEPNPRLLSRTKGA